MGESPSSVLTAEPPVAPAVPARSPWRRRIVAALLVLAVVVGAAWFWASSSSLRSGSVVGGPEGIQPLDDGISQTKWLQTSEDGVVWFSIRNDGRFPVVLGVAPGQEQTYWVGPHVRIGLAPLDPTEGTKPGWPGTLEVSRTVTVQPGGEAYVVYRVLYPSKCLQSDALAHNPSYYINNRVTLTTSTLGRTTETVVPLPYPVYTPSIVNGDCVPEDFAALDARYAVQE